MRVLTSTLLFLALFSTASAETTTVQFNPMLIEYPYTMLKFDDFTIYGSKGTIPQDVIANGTSGLAVKDSDLWFDTALHPKECLTFEFAPTPVRSVVLTQNVLTPGMANVRVRTTFDLQTYPLIVSVDQPIEIGPFNRGEGILSVSLEPVDAIVSVRTLEYSVDRFEPGDVLRIDTLDGDPLDLQWAYFYGVAGMTLECDLTDALPQTKAVVTIRDLAAIVEHELVFNKLGKRSIKLKSSGWFAWTYQSLDGVPQEVEFKTRALFKKRDAKVVRTIGLQEQEDEFGQIDLPVLGGMVTEISVTSNTGSVVDLWFYVIDTKGDGLALEPAKLTKSTVSLAPLGTQSPGTYTFCVEGLAVGQVATITIKRSLPPMIGPVTVVELSN